MAITYTKPLKTITITLMRGGDPIVVSDTASAPIASDALAQFMRGDIMSFPYQDGTMYIPFHAVATIEVTTAESDAITKADPHCTEDDK